jgi:hypothetical protein
VAACDFDDACAATLSLHHFSIALSGCNRTTVAPLVLASVMRSPAGGDAGRVAANAVIATFPNENPFPAPTFEVGALPENTGNKCDARHDVSWVVKQYVPAGSPNTSLDGETAVGALMGLPRVSTGRLGLTVAVGSATSSTPATSHTCSRNFNSVNPSCARRDCHLFQTVQKEKKVSDSCKTRQRCCSLLASPIIHQLVFPQQRENSTNRHAAGQR